MLVAMVTPEDTSCHGYITNSNKISYGCRCNASVLLWTLLEIKLQMRESIFFHANRIMKCYGERGEFAKKYLHEMLCIDYHKTYYIL